MNWNWLPWTGKPGVRDDEPLMAKKPKAAPRILVSMGRFWILRRWLTRISYIRLIHRAGGHPMWVDYGSGPAPDDLKEVARQIISQGDGLILSGGGDVDPELYGGDVTKARNVDQRRDAFELALLNEAENVDIPVLAICRGCQLLNVSRGGTLSNIREDKQRIKTHNRFRLHPIKLIPHSKIATILNQSHLDSVRSVHGQAVGQAGTDLDVAGWAPDGTVEAIECTRQRETNWVLGLQWHPELMLFQNDEHRLIQAFVQEAALTRQRKNPMQSLDKHSQVDVQV